MQEQKTQNFLQSQKIYYSSMVKQSCSSVSECVCICQHGIVRASGSTARSSRCSDDIKLKLLWHDMKNLLS